MVYCLRTEMPMECHCTFLSNLSFLMLAKMLNKEVNNDKHNN